MRFTYTVDVEVKRQRGRFERRKAIATQIQDAIQKALKEADPVEYETQNGGEYFTLSWEVHNYEGAR
jgi:hypothetical protein